MSITQMGILQSSIRISHRRISIIPSYIKIPSHIRISSHIRIQPCLPSLYSKRSKQFYSTNEFKSLHVNDTFQHLLETPRDAFKFVVKNAPQANLDPGLLEVFFYNLILSHNITSATTLLHVLHNYPGFRVSNEVWSAYTSEVLSQGSHIGAVSVYHHLVDNVLNYSEDKMSAYSTTNPYIPFMLSLGTLELLSAIFADCDPVRAKGILAYFKRFYSYIAHKSTYKNLMINVVEAYSSCGDRESAFRHFRRLAYILGPKNSIHVARMQNAAVFSNRVWRNKNIEENNAFEVADDLKTPIDEEIMNNLEGVQPYNPMIENNVYVDPGKKALPLLRGLLKTSDLPQFHAKIVKPLVESTVSTTDSRYLHSLYTSVHPLLAVFIVRSFCEMDREKDAFKLISSFTDEAYAIFFHYARSNLRWDAIEMYLKSKQHTRAVLRLFAQSLELVDLERACEVLRPYVAQKEVESVYKKLMRKKKGRNLSERES